MEHSPTTAETIMGLIHYYDFAHAEWANDPTVASDVERLVAQGCTADDYTHAIDWWSGMTDVHDAWPVIRDYMPQCAERRRQRQGGPNGR